MEEYLSKNFRKNFLKFLKFFKSINFVFFFRKFLKCIYDVRELFSSDDVTYTSLAKLGDYLREIQALFSVNKIKQNKISFDRYVF